MRGNDIREFARKQLKDFIVFEGRLLYQQIHGKNPNFEEDEEWELFIDDIKKNVELRVTIEVWDSEDTTIEEKWTLKSIRITLDDNLFFTFEEDGGDDEEHYGVLSVDDLAEIANFLEEEYSKSLLKK